MQIRQEDAASQVIAEGDWVRIESRRGKVEARARIGTSRRAGSSFLSTMATGTIRGTRARPTS